MIHFSYKQIILIILLFFSSPLITIGSDFSNHTFLVAEGSSGNFNNARFWRFFQSSDFVGIEVKVKEINQSVIVQGYSHNFDSLLHQLQNIIEEKETKVIPVFIHFEGNISVLDSIIKNSTISNGIFYLPQGETWPALEYLVQSNRRIIFFVTGNYTGESKVFHDINSYILRIAGDDIAANINEIKISSSFNPELFMVDELDKIPIKSPPNTLSNNVVPDHINFLLENWTNYGKRPNFLFIGENYSDFDLMVEQLNSFSWINGIVTYAGKILERVYWKNPDVTVTSGRFSFPIRGGEEIILSPFVPGYEMTPQQIVVTGEMAVPESFSFMATPTNLAEKITGSFSFEDTVNNFINPAKIFEGENYSFTQDLERGNVLKLPENANINLGDPEEYGLRNSSFTVSCYVKFNEIIEFGDNAILGNFESGYRMGFHLILRSGHPYFGLWANDYVSEEILRTNIWYHLAWRYIIETGEQAIFLNGRNIGRSEGHPPYSGTGDIHLGSALSSGASLRGYIDDLYLWNRPLGNEEINRLSLNENIIFEDDNKNTKLFSSLSVKIITGFLLFALLLVLFLVVVKKFRKNKSAPAIHLPPTDSANQIKLFGKFKAIDKSSVDITDQFTPKVRELFLFILIHSVNNENGASVIDINKHLWNGIPPEKVANNRAVTLNKLRKILNRLDGIQVVSQNGFIQTQTEEPLFCDFIEAYQLCQISGELSKQQLESFFQLVKKGRFLKEMIWPWLDEIRGLTGNQVIDNLLKLASIYKKENKLKEIDAVSRRILEYDDLNEEAIYLLVMVLQNSNNVRLAKYNFDSFCTKYQESMGEPYPMNFDKFVNHYSKIF